MAFRNYLLIDTCVWLYLAEGKHPADLIHQLYDAVMADRARLLLPEIIIDEWNRNKVNIEPAVKKRYDDHLNQLIAQASKLSLDQDPVAKKALDELIDRALTVKQQKIKDVQEAISFIETLFAHSTSVNIKIKDSHRLKAVELALNKKAPFGERNSMGDALIIISASEFIDEMFLQFNKCFFVTENIRDFSAKDDKEKLHLDIQSLLSYSFIDYYIHLGKALALLAPVPSSFRENEDDDEEQYGYFDPESGEYLIECFICISSDDNFLRFSRPFTIEDGTTTFIDPNQLWFDFVDEKDRVLRIPRTGTTIQEAVCPNCDTHHIKCQHCDEVICLEEVESGEPFVCPGDCGIVYCAEKGRSSHKWTYRVVSYDAYEWEKEQEEDDNNDEDQIAA